MPLLWAVIAFAAGAMLDRVGVNSSNDTGYIDKVIDQIDQIANFFHERLCGGDSSAQFNEGMFNYHVRSLVDDTTLLPIIGRTTFDGEYTRLITNIFGLSTESPGDVSAERKRELLDEFNQEAVKLKKVINNNRKRWRVFDQK